ncbi:MAG: transglutaminase domain-containing protein [Treponema sp.]|nr:transglutaminase domain-containing protein [Treponema sp.]
MKRIVQFVICISVMLCAACSSLDYVVKDKTQNIAKLKTCADYNSEPVNFEIKNMVDEKQSAIIRKYFKENAGLDLDALASSNKTTWEEAVELAVFVAKNIPHDNQKEWLDDRCAIPLWEYSRRVTTGFNCRWHSIILSELMLSAGIKNRFITCLPEDKDDGDCHVVNVVWLPELNKWAMIDSDMVEYVVDEDEVPLSLTEMRDEIIAGRELNVRVLPGFEDSWVAQESGIKYMQAYWAKNLYWFAAHTTYGFNLEGTNRPSQDLYSALIPPGYDCSAMYDKGHATSNKNAFWDIK